jgi:hypothetical protein
MRRGGGPVAHRPVTCTPCMLFSPVLSSTRLCLLFHSSSNPLIGHLRVCARQLHLATYLSAISLLSPEETPAPARPRREHALAFGRLLRLAEARGRRLDKRAHDAHRGELARLVHEPRGQPSARVDERLEVDGSQAVLLLLESPDRLGMTADSSLALGRARVALHGRAVRRVPLPVAAIGAAHQVVTRQKGPRQRVPLELHILVDDGDLG